MKTPRQALVKALTLHECKIRAEILLKDLLCDDRPRALRAADRLRTLPAFAAQDSDSILEQRVSIRHKHTLTVIALELGYPDWTACKRRLELPANRRLETVRFFQTQTGQPIGAAYLNRWFAR